MQDNINSADFPEGKSLHSLADGNTVGLTNSHNIKRFSPPTFFGITLAHQIDRAEEAREKAESNNEIARLGSPLAHIQTNLTTLPLDQIYRRALHRHTLRAKPRIRSHAGNLGELGGFQHLEDIGAFSLIRLPCP